MIRTVLVAPYAGFRAELESRLTEAEDCVIVGAISGSEEIELLLSDRGVDVVIVDASEEQAVRKHLLTLAGHYELGVVLLDDLAESVQQMAVSEVAAWAVIRPDSDNQELTAALRAVAAGLVVVDRALIARLSLAQQPSTSICPSAEASTATGSVSISSASTTTFLPSETLTVREREVLQLMAQGLANKQIGGKLSISLHTVKFHVASILAKFNASSRTEAVTLGARRGLVTL